MQKNRLFCTCFLQSLEFFGGNTDQKIFYHQLEQEKLFNLITNFMQIGLSKAAKYWNLWKMSKLPLKLKPQFFPSKTFHLWNALKSKQKMIETCGLYHWLALELYFQYLFEFLSISTAKRLRIEAKPAKIPKHCYFDIPLDLWCSIKFLCNNVLICRLHH